VRKPFQLTRYVLAELACHRLVGDIGLSIFQKNRQTADRTTQEYRRPDVPVRLAGGTDPGLGGNP
jgi:hypothetical protein